MPELRVYLFGGLAVTWDQDPLPVIPGAVARSLFAYLLTYRGRSHPHDLRPAKSATRWEWRTP